MNWEKKGVIWTPDKSGLWAQSHATCPTPIEINKDTGKCKDLMYKHFVHHVETRMKNTILGILGISI